MNERIHKLAEECRFVRYGENGEYIPEGIDEEKFAKLIVQDCVSEIALMGVTNFENEDISWACRVIIDSIKSKFGV